MRICLLHRSFYLLILLLEISTAFGSEIRLQSMGNTGIALPDSENEINLHDFGRNFAWILEDQSANWTRLEGAIGYQRGSFHRTYDPEQVISMSGRYSVLQHIGERNIVYGAIEYADVSRKNVYSTSDRQPYSGHPFRVTDATTGNIHSYGPRLRLTYNNALFKQHLFWAGTITYQVESGLKKAIIKPENIYRNVGLMTAIAFKISRRFSIGFTVDYHDSQENIEYVSPDKIAPFFYDINLFVSEQSFLPLADNMGIIKNRQQFRYGLQTVLCFAEGAAGFRFSYLDENMDVDKKSNYRLQNSGFWNQSGYELQLITRHRISGSPFWGGLLVHYRSISNNARHWIYQAKLSNTKITGSYFGGGLGYASPRSKVKAALEYRHGVHRFDKNDVNSKLFADGVITDRGIHCGLEYAFSGSLSIRTGYQVYRNMIHPDLLIFSEFNKSHWKYVCSGGIGYLFEKIRLECHVQYTFTRQRETVTPASREDFLIRISTEILK